MRDNQLWKNWPCLATTTGVERRRSEDHRCGRLQRGKEKNIKKIKNKKIERIIIDWIIDSENVELCSSRFEVKHSKKVTSVFLTNTNLLSSSLPFSQSLLPAAAFLFSSSVLPLNPPQTPLSCSDGYEMTFTSLSSSQKKAGNFQT